MDSRAEGKATVLALALSPREAAACGRDRVRPQAPAAPGSLSPLPLPRASPGSSAPPPSCCVFTQPNGVQNTHLQPRTRPEVGLVSVLALGLTPRRCSGNGGEIRAPLYLSAGEGQSACERRLAEMHQPDCWAVPRAPTTRSYCLPHLSHPVWYFLLVFQKEGSHSQKLT